MEVVFPMENGLCFLHISIGEMELLPTIYLFPHKKNNLLKMCTVVHWTMLTSCYDLWQIR